MIPFLEGEEGDVDEKKEEDEVDDNVDDDDEVDDIGGVEIDECNVEDYIDEEGEKKDYDNIATSSFLKKDENCKKSNFYFNVFLFNKS